MTTDQYQRICDVIDSIKLEGDRDTDEYAGQILDIVEAPNV